MSWDFLTVEFIFKYVVSSITALIAIYISWRQKSINKAQQKILESQHRIENEDHRFKLYDRRASVFRQLESFLSNICGKGKVDRIDIEDFEKNIWPDQWLFPSEMYPYFEKLFKIAKTNMLDNEEYPLFQVVSTDKEKLKTNHIQKTRTSFEYLESQRKDLYKTFEKVLRIPDN